MKAACHHTITAWTHLPNRCEAHKPPWTFQCQYNVFKFCLCALHFSAPPRNGMCHFPKQREDLLTHSCPIYAIQEWRQKNNGCRLKWILQLPNIMDAELKWVVELPKGPTFDLELGIKKYMNDHIISVSSPLWSVLSPSCFRERVQHLQSFQLVLLAFRILSFSHFNCSNFSGATMTTNPAPLHLGLKGV